MHIYGQLKLLQTVEKFIKNRNLYLLGGTPFVFVSDLKSGDGITAISHYIAEELLKYKVIRTEGDLEILEYSLDGSLKQIGDMIDDVDDNAVYTNYFDGVVCIDLGELQDYYDEYQTTCLIKYINERAKYTTFVIFAATKDNVQNRLLKRLLDEINGAIYLESTGYYPIEYASIIIDDIKRNGILIETEKELEDCVVQEIKRENLERLKNVKRHFEYLYRCIESKDGYYTLNFELVKKYAK